MKPCGIILLDHNNIKQPAHFLGSCCTVLSKHASRRRSAPGASIGLPPENFQLGAESGLNPKEKQRISRSSCGTVESHAWIWGQGQPAAHPISHRQTPPLIQSVATGVKPCFVDRALRCKAADRLRRDRCLLSKASGLRNLNHPRQKPTPKPK